MRSAAWLESIPDTGRATKSNRARRQSRTTFAARDRRRRPKETDWAMTFPHFHLAGVCLAGTVEGKDVLRKRPLRDFDSGPGWAPRRIAMADFAAGQRAGTDSGRGRNRSRGD